MKASGLYDPAYEHDACGVAFVARLDGVPTHEAVARALTALANLEHRGAAGADADTGDGAGILVQMPDAFLRGARARSSCRRAARTASRSASCRRRRRGAPSSSSCSRRPSPRRARPCSAGATSRSTARHVGRTRASVRAGRSASSSSPRRRSSRPTRRVRAQALRDPPRRRARRRRRTSSSRASPRARSSTRGC